MERSSRYTQLSRYVDVEFARDEEIRQAAVKKLPLGISLLQKSLRRRLSYDVHKFLALLLTFLIYLSYHASRRPLNVVKSILSPYDEVSANVKSCSASQPDTEPGVSESEGWEPFAGKSGEKLLVGLDFTFLFVYAIGVVLAGRIADRSNLRHYLLAGMAGSAVVTALFGMGYYWGIHQYFFYLLLQVVTGLFQASGWPAVVAIVAQWFGKEHLGFIMGLWNAHASVGNIVGSAMSSSVVQYGWGSAFLLLGSFIAGTGIVVWFFVVPQPIDAGFEPVLKKETETSPLQTDQPPTSLDPTSASPEERKSITWMAALSIPGIVPFSIALFFSKFVAYTFLFWLPYYIAAICIHEHQLSAEEAGDFSIYFDVGGIAGGVVAGILYDMTRSGAAISVSYGVCSIPCLLTYHKLGRRSVMTNRILLLLSGFTVNGPYALITTAVSATLGTHESIAGNARALSTVAAIIDGMGSLGAALGPTLTGQILSSSVKDGDSFDLVFLMLALAAVFGALTLSRVAWFELRTNKGPSPPSAIEMERLVGKSISVSHK